MDNVIKRLRQSINMTQQQFAKNIGMRTESIQNWENGRSQPTRKTLARISATFGVSLNWLLTGNGDMRGMTTLDTGDTDMLLLGCIISSLRDSIDKKGVTLNIEQRLKLIMCAYDEFANTYEENKNININESVKKSIDIGIDVIAK